MDRAPTGMTLVPGCYQNSQCTCQQNILIFTSVLNYSHIFGASIPGLLSVLPCFALSYFFRPELRSQGSFCSSRGKQGFQRGKQGFQRGKQGFQRGSAREKVQCPGVRRGGSTRSALPRKSQLCSVTAHGDTSTFNSRFSALLGFSSTTDFPWIKCGHIIMYFCQISQGIG